MGNKWVRERERKRGGGRGGREREEEEKEGRGAVRDSLGGKGVGADRVLGFGELFGLLINKFLLFKLFFNGKMIILLNLLNPDNKGEIVI